MPAAATAPLPTGAFLEGLAADLADAGNQGIPRAGALGPHTHARAGSTPQGEPWQGQTEALLRAQEAFECLQEDLAVVVRMMGEVEARAQRAQALLLSLGPPPRPADPTLAGPLSPTEPGDSGELR